MIEAEDKSGKNVMAFGVIVHAIELDMQCVPWCQRSHRH